MRFIRVIGTFFICLFGSNIKAFAECPSADPGFTAGCIEVPENYQQPEAAKLKIFYQVWGQFDATKKTIIFINGGPGNANIAHNTAKAYLNLSDQFNVLFYDQRGIGRSGSIDENNVHTVNLDHYTTNENIEDLALIIDQIAHGKAAILGHSYGGMLAYWFAVKYPEKLHAMINLAGVTEFSYVFGVSGPNQKYYDELFAKLGKKRIAALFKLVEHGFLHDESINDTLTLDRLWHILNSTTSTYHGQTKVVPKFLQSLLDQNKEWIDQILQASGHSTDAKKILDSSIASLFFHCHLEQMNILIELSIEAYSVEI